MPVQGFFTPAIDQVAGKNCRLTFLVTLNGNTTAASITGSSNAQNGIALVLAAGSLTAPVDANFVGLVSNAAPSVMGVYITDGRAVRLTRVDVQPQSIRSPSMTAVLPTFRGSVSAISGNEGVTQTSGNLAFQLSCTALNLNAQTQRHTFTVAVEYDLI